MTDLEQICRACLQKSKNLLKFERNLTKSLKILECFEILTGIKIKTNENESKICLKCSEKLKSASEFRKQCLENDEKYQELLSNSQSSSSKEKTPIKEEVGSSDDDTQFQTLVEPQLEIKSEVSEEESDYDEFEKAFDTPEKVKRKRYERRVHQVTCNYCGRLFEGKYARKCLKAHEMRIHCKELELEEDPDFTIYCAFCPDTRKFDSWNECDAHERDVHYKGRHFICDLCGFSQKTRSLMKDHINVHRGTKDVECPECDKKFKTRKAMMGHLRYTHKQLKSKKHKDQKSYQCTVCGKAFRHAGSYRDHFRTHSNKLEFQCFKCGKKFQRSVSYSKHLKRHEEDEQGIVVQCSICSKTVKRKELMKAHMLIHSGQKNHKCMYCEKTFFQKNQVTRHVLSMHLITNFNCKICGFEMRVRQDYQKNYIKHIRERHSNELTTEQLELFEMDIRKLKYDDLCHDLPASLKSVDLHCSECQLYFKTNELLQEHKEEVHPALRN